jgi:hypothetical protein
MVQKKQIPYGGDVSAGKFRCSDCGCEITVRSVDSLPPCPNFKKSTHPKRVWDTVTGHGDA